jgi:hypothetical protein
MAQWGLFPGGGAASGVDTNNTARSGAAGANRRPALQGIRMMVPEAIADYLGLTDGQVSAPTCGICNVPAKPEPHIGWATRSKAMNRTGRTSGRGITADPPHTEGTPLMGRYRPGVSQRTEPEGAVSSRKSEESTALGHFLPRLGLLT